ncbi:MAG: MotA/TolQ/ExbB proton channel family protein [Planctomycetes bacterium]|nr:MotA/TolQ/ExbB proton channel family protein [Planctomycetota bacterium]
MLQVAHETERPHAHERPSILSRLQAVGWPVLLGLAATSLFFVLIYRGPLNLPIMHRYFASHPVTFCETGLFFIGLAALLLKGLSVLGEHRTLYSAAIPQVPATASGGDSIALATELLDRIDSLPARLRESLIGRRYREALEHVERNSSASGLNDELKYLSDIETGRQQDSYSLVRIVVWATPMLGFLGTVMGITEALGDLSENAGALASSPETAIQGLLGGLYVAFDTTALALTLSMILMFIQFLIERVEIQLLSDVDTLVNEALIGRFPDAPAVADPQVAVIERMVQAVLRATESLVERQTQLWSQSISAAQEQWRGSLESTGDRLRTTFTSSLEQSLDSHAHCLVESQRGIAGQIRQEWQTVVDGLNVHAQLLVNQQTELARQGETVTEILQASRDVIQLEQALNSNLAALAGSKNFEDTVMSLAAAIHLLNTRLGKTDSVPAISLQRDKQQGKAA